MSEWQPIETAPKSEGDADVIALWRDGTGQTYAGIAFYRSREEVERIGWACGLDHSDVGWWTYVNSFTQVRIEPEFWMPYESPYTPEGT